MKEYNNKKINKEESKMAKKANEERIDKESRRVRQSENSTDPFALPSMISKEIAVENGQKLKVWIEQVLIEE